MGPTTILSISIWSFLGKNECCITFWNKNRYVWFPKIQGQFYASNPHLNFILAAKQAEGKDCINQVNINFWDRNTIFLCQNIKALCLGPTTILSVSIRSFWDKNECCITFCNKNRYVWFPKMQGQWYASNPNQNFILGLKKAEGNHSDPNERFSS